MVELSGRTTISGLVSNRESFLKSDDRVGVFIVKSISGLVLRSAGLARSVGRWFLKAMYSSVKLTHFLRIILEHWARAFQREGLGIGDVAYWIPAQYFEFKNCICVRTMLLFHIHRRQDRQRDCVNPFVSVFSGDTRSSQRSKVHALDPWMDISRCRIWFSEFQIEVYQPIACQNYKYKFP